MDSLCYQTYFYRQIASDKLLSKCLHGETQNKNRCLNSLVW